MNTMSAAAAPPEQSASVFVVEDEALIAMELRDRLSSLGYVVKGTASHGERALEAILAGLLPDVVIMDIHLAGKLDGIQTAARLRAAADVPVIFLSAYSDSELLRQAGTVEPFGYLVKPFEERELHATIQMALYKHRMERALREANARLDEKVRERTAELAQSRENLAVTLNSIGDAVLATDAKGYITHLNPVAERLTGWPRAEAVGRPIAEVFRIVNDVTRAPAVMPVDRVLATGEIHTLATNTVLLTRSGTELSIADSAAPIRDAAGRIIGAVLVFRDETEARERRKLVARQGTMLGALRRVQEQFIRSPEDAGSFDDILSVLLYSTHSDSGFIGEVVYTPQDEPRLKLQAMTEPAWDVPGGARRTSLANLFEAVMRGGKPVVANDFTACTGDGDRLAGQPPITAFLGAPINMGGRVVGMIGVANRRGGYDERVLAEIQPLLATYGSLIVAWRNALRRRAAEDSLRELNANLEAEVQRRTAALMASEQRYSELVERINDAIVRDDAEGRLVYANHHFLEWFGLGNRELHEIVLEDFLAPEWRPIVRDLHDRRVRGEQVPDRFECEGLGASGRRLWLDVFVAPVMERGRIAGTQAVIRDVTERRKVDEALRRSLAMFEALATLSPVGIFRTDAAGECLFVNTRWCAIAGTPCADAMGSGWMRTLHPEDRERVIAEWRSAVSSGTAFNADYRFVAPDGQITWVLGQAVPTTDANGETSGYIGTLTDITERRNAERQASRTQRLESIGTLAGGIAHDLNNALTPILMTIDVLKEQYPAETEMLETVQRSANHAAQMVRHLLAFAKGTESSRVPLQPLQLIGEMEKIVKGTFPKNIQVQVRAPKTLPGVLGDATQLHQVLLNLCVNARDAMPGGGMLTLEAETLTADAAIAGNPNAEEAQRGPYVVLRVTDTGGGIAPDILDRIFDPFFTTKGPEAGTGLGLFTAAGIVKGHGGFLRVDSRPPRGSTFAVYLPAEPVGQQAPEADEVRVPAFLGSGETILYVDDERNVRNAAEAVLSRLNFAPLLAEDAMSGLVQAVQRRDSLHAVITDVHMPHMDGLAFVRALRRALPDIPVIVASGRLEGQLAVEFRKLGVNVMLDKPFTQDMLVDALKAALQRS